MKVKSRLLIASILMTTIASFFSGCASGPELEKYPQREIDRPYTLPKGVANWHILTVFGHVKDDYSSTTIAPIPVPLIWETSLSDDWNLIWFPLPLGFSHQFSYSENGYTGFSLITGFSYSSISGFRLQPNISFTHRHKFSQKLALEITPSFTPDFPFRDDENFLWSAGLSAGPLFQLNNTFALKPNASLGVSRGRFSNISGYFDDLSLANETAVSFGLGASGVLSIGRQWDFRPSYNYFGIGSKNGLQAHIATIDFIHFW